MPVSMLRGTLVLFLLAGAGSLANPGNTLAQEAGAAGPATTEAASRDERGLLGVRVRKQEDGVMVLGIYAGSGAADAGILPGDLITSCDGNDLGPLDRNAAFGLLRGPVGSQAPVTIRRATERVELSVERRGNGARTTTPMVLARSRMAAKVSALRRNLTSDPETAVAAFLEELNELEPDQRALGCLRSAQAAIQQQPSPEKIQAVMPLAEEAARLGAEDAALLLDLARLFYMPAGAQLQAETILRRSLELLQGEHDQAQDPLDRIRIDGMKHQAAVALGSLLEQDGRHQELVETLEPLAVRPYSSVLLADASGGLEQGIQTRRDRLQVLVASAHAALGNSSGGEELARQLGFGEDHDVRRRLSEAVGAEEAGRMSPLPQPLAQLRGREAPLLQGELAAGGLTNLQESEGHWTLVIFWATWCGPCKRELPYVQQWWDELGPKGLRVIAVATDQNPAVVRPFLEENDYSFPVLMGGQREMGQWGVAGIPAGFLIDPDGRIHAGWRGFNQNHIDALGQRLRTLVDEEAGGEPGTYFARWTGSLAPQVRWLASVPSIHALAEHANGDGPSRLVAGRDDGGLLLVEDGTGTMSPSGMADVGPRTGGRLQMFANGEEGIALSMKRRGQHLWLSRPSQTQSLLVHTSRNRIGGFDLGDLDGDGQPETAVAEPGAGDLVLRTANGGVAWRHPDIRGPLDVVVRGSQLLVLTDEEVLELNAEGEVLSRRAGPGAGYGELSNWEEGLMLHDRGVSEVETLRRGGAESLLMVRAGKRISVLGPDGGVPLLVLELEAGEVDAESIDLDGDGTDELVISSSEFGLLALDLPMSQP